MLNFIIFLKLKKYVKIIPMNDLIEIRWHARGGQGAKTASLLFAEAMLQLGKYVQSFPEYGPERTGAPIKAYNRISSKPVKNYSAILNPDIVIVLDSSLLNNLDVLSGLDKEGVLVVNTEKTKDEIIKNLKVKNVVAVPASLIAEKFIGKRIPNTVMLGVLFKILNLDFKIIYPGLSRRLKLKFKSKPEFIEKNLKAIKEAYNLSNK